jgi:predicted RNA-binding protein with PUA-like domain
VIKTWKIGDMMIIYHSLGEARIVGLAKVTGSPEKDENDSRGISWHAKVKFIKEFTEDQKITLKEIKQLGIFNDFALVRQSRLSTMECPDNFVNWLKEKGVL